MNTQVLLKKAEDMKKKAKKNKKGFTLVELIVVLVIIAILAAVLVPTMSGYIGKTKKSAAQSECKTVVTAAASVGTDIIAEKGAVSVKTAQYGSTAADTFNKFFIDKCKEYGGSSVLDHVDSVKLDPSTGAVLEVQYTSGSYYCLFANNKYYSGKGTLSSDESTNLIGGTEGTDYITIFVHNDLLTT